MNIDMPLRTQGRIISLKLLQYLIRKQVELALAEAKAVFKSYQIDLKHKPEWYASKINPAGKVCPILTIYFCVL